MGVLFLVARDCSIKWLESPNFCDLLASTSLCSTSDAHRNVVLPTNDDIALHWDCFAWRSSSTSSILKHLISLACSFIAIHPCSSSKSIPLRIDVHNTKLSQKYISPPDTLLVRRNRRVGRRACIQRGITDQTHARGSSELSRQDIPRKQRMGNLNYR